MIIVGLTGFMEHGKTTFAKALVKLKTPSVHFETHDIVAEVARALHEHAKVIPNPSDLSSINLFLKPLTNIVSDILHAQISDINLTQDSINNNPDEYEKLLLHISNLADNPKLLKSSVTEKNKPDYRPILQWLGGYFVKHIDKGIWYKEILRRAYLAKSKGCVLFIISGLRFPGDADLVKKAGGIVAEIIRPNHEKLDVNDVTERERSLINPDITIINNGGLEELKSCAASLLDDLEEGKLKKTYRAA